MQMTQIMLIFIAGMVAGAFLPRLSAYWHRRQEEREAEEHSAVSMFETADLPKAPPEPAPAPRRKQSNVFRPPAGVVAQQKEKKEANMQAILGAFAWATEGKLRTEDVEKMLGVSESTALRYLEELEKEHKIRREIAADRKVYYVKLP